ncbi:MAG: sugar phosphate isomerase/epimerase [Armatimonadetes bacterium]|nr:sugar phosphate isomerase/epimerase [Armatimonadota bacterium]
MGDVDTSRFSFSTACLANHSLEEAAHVGRELGFRGIELLAFDGYRHSQGDLAGFYFDRLTTQAKDRLRELVAPFEHVSTHAPFIDIALFAPNPGVREEAFRQIVVAIEATAFLGGSSTTAHACEKAGYAFEEYRPEIVDTFRRLGDHAGKAGITLTIETGYPVGVEAFAQLIDDIAHPAVGANVDVGHLVGYLPVDARGTAEGAERYRQTLLQQLHALGGKVYHFHLHDLRESDFRDHRAVGRGFLNWPAIMRWCVDARYEGLFALELEEPDMVPALRESKAAVERGVRAEE